MKFVALFLVLALFAASSHGGNPSGEWHGFGEGWPYTYLKIENNGSTVLAFFDPNKPEDMLNPLVFRAGANALKWIDGAYTVKFCSEACEEQYSLLVFTVPGAPVEPDGFVVGNLFRYSNWRKNGAQYLQYFPIKLSVKQEEIMGAFSMLEKHIANK